MPGMAGPWRCHPLSGNRCNNTSAQMPWQGARWQRQTPAHDDCNVADGLADRVAALEPFPSAALPASVALVAVVGVGAPKAVPNRFPAAPALAVGSVAPLAFAPP